MNELFQAFNEINKKLQSELLEISIRQHQISYVFNGNTLGIEDIIILDNIPKAYESNGTYITVVDDFILLTFGGWLANEDSEDFIFKQYIEKISDKICKCPALEFVVSSQYIKCFLDKGGLTVDDLVSYEELMGAKGTIETTPQRPYLLFINESYYLEEDNDI